MANKSILDFVVLCCVYTCGHESSQGGFRFRLLLRKRHIKLNLFYDNNRVKSVAENSE